MIFPSGYISIDDAYQRWLGAVRRNNEMREEELLNQSDDESILIRFEESVGMFSADLVARAIDTYVVLESGQTLRIDSEVALLHKSGEGFTA